MRFSCLHPTFITLSKLGQTRNMWAPRISNLTARRFGREMRRKRTRWRDRARRRRTWVPLPRCVPRSHVGYAVPTPRRYVQGRRGSKVIVIHPGSRFLRIGRASDVTPATIPNVIARKHKPPVPPPVFVEGISRPRKDRERGQVSTVVQPGDEYSVGLASDDPVSKCTYGCSSMNFHLHFLSATCQLQYKNGWQTSPNGYMKTATQ